MLARGGRGVGEGWGRRHGGVGVEEEGVVVSGVADDGTGGRGVHGRVEDTPAACFRWRRVGGKRVAMGADVRCAFGTRRRGSV